MSALSSVQLYSLGAASAQDPAGVVARLSRIGYRGVEPVLNTGTSEALLSWARANGAPVMPSIDVAALRRALDDQGMVAHSCHVALPEGQFANQILDEQELLGGQLLVTPVLFDSELGALEAFDNLDSIKRLAERFNLAAERARTRGMRVGYHNHFWEFGTDFDGRSGLELFFEMVEPDVFIEVDVYWAQVGGCDPAKLIDSLGDQVLLLHLKDGDGVAGTPSLPFGTGVVDLSAVMSAAKSARWHIVELEGLTESEVWPALEQSHSDLLRNELDGRSSS